jgi:hypothetical protein
MYDQLTSYLRENGYADINPDSMRHIMRGYLGTISQFTEGVFEILSAVTSDEDFAVNYKAALYPLRGFIGSPYSQQPSDYHNHSQRVGGLKEQINLLRRSGTEKDLATADEIEGSDFYQNNITNYETYTKQYRDVNAKYKDVLRAGDTTRAQARNTNDLRNAELGQVYRAYLEGVVN